ncbi:hypothetical protein CMUS01_02710 [Colletotrichum musicola]|uniref:Uncharacterized protein n=1 Tax=Colletotrichum musicola TaxID=2175873 RepID=A0A8H6NUG7_9PEZI|nr:hypothetical protein CMUS01_02710 [Colletotrichum musicola]
MGPEDERQQETLGGAQNTEGREAKGGPDSSTVQGAPALTPVVGPLGGGCGSDRPAVFLGEVHLAVLNAQSPPLSRG